MTLFCKLFGHKFIGFSGVDDDGLMIKERLNYCVRCGLSKEEIERLKSAENTKNGMEEKTNG